MIERYIQNPTTLKSWRRFKKIRRSVISCWVLGVLILVSLTAEFWANNKPIVMHFNGAIYFPAVKKYHPTVFGQKDISVTDYRALNLTDGGNWAIWPLVKWDP